METKIRRLSNEDYHRSPEFAEYVSSTQLKEYLKSPMQFRHQQLYDDHEETPAMHLGSLFHATMEHYIENGSLETIADTIAVFDPPKNPKTEKPYGATTNAYQNALESFLAEHKGGNYATEEELSQVLAMAESVTEKSESTALVVKRFCRWAKEVETSYLLNEDGVKLKVRPDLLTNGKLVDWKTTSLDSLSEENVVKTILKYRYDISLSMYQYVLHKVYDIWYTPYLVIVQSKAPYDSIVVDMTNFCFDYSKEADMMLENVGAKEFLRLKALHKQCLESNEWRGADNGIEPDDNGLRIMKPSVPAWLDRKMNDDY